MEQDPDIGLVRELGSDDASVRRHALGVLYERHRKRVFNVAVRVLGDWSAALDVTQEVFLLLVSKARSFRGESAVTSWIYRITVNRAIDAHRHERRRPARRSAEEALEGAAAASPSRPEPDLPGRALDRDEDARRVQECLARISPKLRAVLVLRYLEGLSYESLAEVLDCSVGTVKSRLNRAHSAMEREMLGDDVPRPPEPGEDDPVSRG